MILDQLAGNNQSSHMAHHAGSHKYVFLYQILILNPSRVDMPVKAGILVYKIWIDKKFLYNMRSKIPRKRPLSWPNLVNGGCQCDSMPHVTFMHSTGLYFHVNFHVNFHIHFHIHSIPYPFKCCSDIYGIIIAAITMPADALEPNGARPSAGIVLMIKSDIFASKYL